MGNSEIIEDLKTALIGAMINDEECFNLIDPPEDEGITFDNSEDLVQTHIFRYHQNPLVINKEITFVTITVDITGTIFDKTHVSTYLGVDIYSHKDHMILPSDKFPGITANRNDYLSMWFDKLISQKSTIDETSFWDRFSLISNTEGAIEERWLYRSMEFSAKDFTVDLCKKSKWVYEAHC